MSNYALSAVLSLKDNFTTTIRSFQRENSAIEKSALKSGSAIERLGSKMWMLGKTATRVAVGSAVAFSAMFAGTGALAIKNAADFETYLVMLETAFTGNKKKAQEYFAWANKFANQTPFTNKEVVEATVMFSNSGLEAKDVLGIAGDLAGAMGKSLDDTVQAIIKARRGHYDILTETFGYTKEMVNEEAKELGLGDLLDNKNAIKDTGKFFDALTSLIQKKAGGGMEKLALTLKGQWSTILGQTGFALARFAGMNENGTVRAGSAFEMLKDVAETVIGKINKALEDGTVDNWVLDLDSKMKSVKTYLGNIWENIKNVTSDDLKNWGERTKTVLSSVETVFSGLAASIEYLSKNLWILKYAGAFTTGAAAGGIFGTVIAPGVGTATGAVLGGLAGIATQGINDVLGSDYLKLTTPLGEPVRNTGANSMTSQFDDYQNSTNNNIKGITLNVNPVINYNGSQQTEADMSKIAKTIADQAITSLIKGLSDNVAINV